MRNEANGAADPDALGLADPDALAPADDEADGLGEPDGPAPPDAAADGAADGLEGGTVTVMPGPDPQADTRITRMVRRETARTTEWGAMAAIVTRRRESG
jgi:hypothetical protein